MKLRDSYTTKEALKRLGDNMSTSFAHWLRDQDITDYAQNCLGCRHMAANGPAFCNKFNMVPPCTVIVGARPCEGFADNEEIPF